MTAVAVESSDGLDGRREEVLQARRELCEPVCGRASCPEVQNTFIGGTVQPPDCCWSFIFGFWVAVL